MDRLSTVAFTADLAGAASESHMIAHLTAPFAGGATATTVPIDGSGHAAVAWQARLPLLLACLRTDLDDVTLTLTGTVDGGATLPTAVFAPYTETGASLPLYLPTVTEQTALAQPFGVSFTATEDGAAVPTADIGTLFELTVLEGNTGRMLYVLAAEKQRMRRQGRELAAMRLLGHAHDDALDQLGAELGVGRFTDVIAYDPTSQQVVSLPRTDPGGREPDVEYRRRLALYKPLMQPTPRTLQTTLNGNADPVGANDGALNAIDSTLTSRLSFIEAYSPFAVGVKLVATGQTQSFTNFLRYLRTALLVWPLSSAAGNDAHASRLLSTAGRAADEALRTRLRQAFTYTGDATNEVAFAPGLAAALDRVGRCRTALGAAGTWTLTRGQADDGGSRYELGLGADLTVPADLDALATAAADPNRAPSADTEIEALIRTLAPQPAASDPEGKWLLNPCGLQTVQRVDVSTLYVSHTPEFGVVIDGPSAVDASGWALLVPGDFGGPDGTDLLVYDRSAGTGQFYAVDGATLTVLGASKTGWRTSWRAIVAGRFDQSGHDALLFYDAAAGEAEFWTFQPDGDTFTRIGATNSGWRTTWSQVVCGSFGSGNLSDLLLYDRDSGEIELLAAADPTALAQIGETLTGVRRTWDAIIVGSFTGAATNDLLLYDRLDGLGEIWTVSPTGIPRLLASHPDWSRSWSHIASGFFYTGPLQDVLFYDRGTGAAEIVTVASDGSLELVTSETWATDWTHVAPSDWNHDAAYTDLLFYDRGAGRAEVDSLVTVDGDPPPIAHRLTLNAVGPVSSPGPAATQTYEAHYYAAESQGSNVVLAEGLTAAAAAWAAGGREAWTVLSNADGETALAAATVSDTTRQAFFDGGFPDLTDLASLQAQLPSVPADLYVVIQLGPTFAAAIGAGGGADDLHALISALGDAGISSAVGFTGPGGAYVAAGVVSLPAAGLNLAERRAVGFRWFAIPLVGLAAEIGSAGAITPLAPTDDGLTAIVVVSYGRKPGLSDPYEFIVDLPSGSTLNLLQYEFLMNALDLTHPAGVGVNTYRIRHDHVALDEVVTPLPPSISRTYRQYRRRRARGNKTSVSPTGATPPTGAVWYSLGGAIGGGLDVVANQDGRLEAFAVGDGRDLVHLWQQTPGTDWSDDWSSLGTPTAAINLTGELSAGRNADGRIEVFARGSDTALWHIWQTAPNNGWSGWASLGGEINAPLLLGTNQDGRLEVFARGLDNAIWHTWQTAPSNGWSGWASLGGVLRDQAALGINHDGRLELFGRGTDDAVWHTWQIAPNAGWSGWASLGGSVETTLAVTTDQDGRLETFAARPDATLWRNVQSAPGGGWTSWTQLGGGIGAALALAPAADGSLALFAATTDDAVVQLSQVAPNGAWSSGWRALGGFVRDDIVAAPNADGRIEVFVRADEGDLRHIWQTTPNGSWNT